MIQIETFEADSLDELREAINDRLAEGKHGAVSSPSIHIATYQARTVVESRVGGSVERVKVGWYAWLEFSSVRPDLVRRNGGAE